MKLKRHLQSQLDCNDITREFQEVLLRHSHHADVESFLKRNETMLSHQEARYTLE